MGIIGRPAKHPIQEFNGIKYYFKREGYYKADYNLYKPTRYMHRDVWAFHNGAIPDGYEIHHIDENKANNSIENLTIMLRGEHASMHCKERFKRDPKKHNRGVVAAREAAKAWHSSPEGKAWHSEHAKEIMEKRPRETRKCVMCGDEYIGVVGLEKRGFCRKQYCQQKARHLRGVDNVERNCIVCNKIFVCNKNTKTKTCCKDCSNQAIREANRRI